MRGTLYGVGVGPGDPELMTLKALRVIQECDVIAVPGPDPSDSTAYKIAERTYPEIREKQILPIPTPMTKDQTLLSRNYREQTEIILHLLDSGKSIAMLTLGDPCVYSTYMYIHKLVRAAGYPAEIISGVPSFCAAAARIGISLAEREEQMHIIPASYQLEDALALPGTKVFMKAGSRLTDLKQLLQQQNCDTVMIENCGMENEHIYRSAEEIPEQGSYYSLIIVKDAFSE